MVVETWLLFACCVFVAVKFLWCGEIKKRQLGRENFFGCMCAHGLRAKGEVSIRESSPLVHKLFTVCCNMLFVALQELQRYHQEMSCCCHEQ